VNYFTNFCAKLAIFAVSEFSWFMSKPYTSFFQENEAFVHEMRVLMQDIDLFEGISRLVVFLVCLAFLAACERHSSLGGTQVPNIKLTASGTSQKTLRRGLLGEPQTLDPQLADDTYSFQVIRDLYEGLTDEDRSGRIVPGVASSWTVNSAGTAYTFQLRPDARWSDGTRIVAEDFVRGLRHAVDPQTASGSAATLIAIKGAGEIIAGRMDVSQLGVVALGDSTLQIRLEHPAPFILEILSQPTAAPLEAKSSSRIAGDSSRNTRVANNGAYILVSHLPGAYMELQKNPYYWDAANVGINTVKYINIESEATELREYLAGQLDLTYTIPAPDLQRISQEYPAEVQNEPFLGTLYLALNLSTTPMKNNKELRQALSMSVDREVISERVMMGVTPAYTLVAKGIAGYTPAAYIWSTWSRDQQLSNAKKLYEKAGYSERNPLHLKLYFNQDEGIRRLMIAIAGSWKQNLGVDCELVADEFRVFLAGRKDKHRWDVARLGWMADYADPSSFLNVFSRESGENDSGYVNTTFSALLNDAESEPDDEQRMALLRKAEQVLLDDYPIIPVYFYRARRLVKPYLGGAQLTSMNRTYSKHLFWRAVAAENRTAPPASTTWDIAAPRSHDALAMLLP
jgi:oligopeptide transport system substrate-binding protein